MAGGTVRRSLVSVKVRAKRNSFHETMKARSPVVTAAGAISGRNTRRTTIQGVAPSTKAASSISFGNSRMKVVSTQIVKGRGEHEIGEDQAGQGVVEAEAADQLEHAGQHGDLRKHRDGEDRHEQQRAAAERDAPEGIGCRDAECERQGDHAAGHDDRVQDVLAEGLALEDGDVVREVEPLGQ